LGTDAFLKTASSNGVRLYIGEKTPKGVGGRHRGTHGRGPWRAQAENDLKPKKLFYVEAVQSHHNGKKALEKKESRTKNTLKL